VSTTERQERRSALDDFAAKTVPQATEMVTVAAGPPAEMIHGAQAVAVHRDERMVLTRIRELAAAAGQDWYFRFPVKNKKQGGNDWIEGPSVQLALDVARIYGNVEIDCRAQDLGNVLLYYARFHDVETGFSLTRPFQQRKGASRLGGADEGRRDEIDFQIGASKAIRNVIVNALRTYTNFGFEEAKEALVDKIGSQIERYRRTTVERIGKLVTLDRVEAVIGRKSGEWLAPDIARVIAMGKAISDGMATVDETFPPLGHSVPHRPDTGEVLDDFAASGPDNPPISGPSPRAGEAAAEVSHPTPPKENKAAATDLKAEIIDGILKTATDTKINPNPQDRLEALDVAEGILMGSYPDHADFIGKAIRIASKVVIGETPVDKAREYMGGLSWDEEAGQ